MGFSGNLIHVMAFSVLRSECLRVLKWAFCVFTSSVGKIHCSHDISILTRTREWMRCLF